MAPSSHPSPSPQQVPLRRFNPSDNPYPARTSWPPDVMSMDAKHQFRLERRYRRRTQQAYLRPGWVKGVKFAQLTLCGAVVAYSMLWMDWGDKYGAPVAWIRDLLSIDTSKPAIDMDAAHKRIQSAIGGRAVVDNYDAAKEKS